MLHRFDYILFCAIIFFFIVIFLYMWAVFDGIVVVVDVVCFSSE